MQINGTFPIAPISYGLRKHIISLLIICKVRLFSNIIRPLNQGDHKHQSPFCSVPTEQGLSLPGAIQRVCHRKNPDF